MNMQLVVNGTKHDIDADPDTPLLWILREKLGHTGVKFGCGVAACGACTVHLNGAAARSCSIPVQSVVGVPITTIEGLAAGPEPHAVQQAWIANQVPQCGYCQSGMIMASAALLARNPNPTDADIDAEITNICRCATYERVRKAIHAAAANIRSADPKAAAGGPRR